MGVLQKDYSKAVRMYQDGLSIGDVAKVHGISRQAMWDILIRRNVRMRPQLRWGQENHFFRGTKAFDPAQNKMEKAIARGRVKRPEACEMCGNKPPKKKNGASQVEAHHPDYNKPLEVMWLCQRCHHKWHKENHAIQPERR
jgi:predicted DNA-binding protein YlxM (UPF0122 family)